MAEEKKKSKKRTLVSKSPGFTRYLPAAPKQELSEAEIEIIEEQQRRTAQRLAREAAARIEEEAQLIQLDTEENSFVAPTDSSYVRELDPNYIPELSVELRDVVQAPLIPILLPPTTGTSSKTEPKPSTSASGGEQGSNSSSDSDHTLVRSSDSNSGQDPSGGNPNQTPPDPSPAISSDSEDDDMAHDSKFKPRYFCNNKDEESWLTYRVHFQHMRKVNNWDDAKARYILAAHMKGEAASATLHIPTEARGNLENRDIVKELLDEYQSIFLPKAQSETARLEFDMSEQGPTEPILQFASRIRCLFLHAYGIEVEDGDAAMNNQKTEVNQTLIRRFIYGLRDATVQREVFRKSPKSFSDAVAVAMNEHSLNSAQNTLRTGVAVRQGSVNAIGEPNQSTDKTDASTQCFRCQGMGHYARECNAPVANPLPRTPGRRGGRSQSGQRGRGGGNRGRGNQNSRGNRGRGRGGGQRGRGRGGRNSINAIQDQLADLTQQIASMGAPSTEEEGTAPEYEDMQESEF